MLCNKPVPCLPYYNTFVGVEVGTIVLNIRNFLWCNSFISRLHHFHQKRQIQSLQTWANYKHVKLLHNSISINQFLTSRWLPQSEWTPRGPWVSWALAIPDGWTHPQVETPRPPLTRPCFSKRSCSTRRGPARWWTTTFGSFCNQLFLLKCLNFFVVVECC